MGNLGPPRSHKPDDCNQLTGTTYTEPIISLINYSLVRKIQVQWKPLHVIAEGQRESDNTNQMITISNLLLIKVT
jgi:hypothetical protein